MPGKRRGADPFLAVEPEALDFRVFGAVPLVVLVAEDFLTVRCDRNPIHHDGAGVGQHAGRENNGRVGRRFLAKVGISTIPEIVLCWLCCRKAYKQARGNESRKRSWSGCG